MLEKKGAPKEDYISPRWSSKEKEDLSWVERQVGADEETRKYG